MTAIETRILKLYERAGLSIEEIAEEENLSELAVKSVLIQFSPTYRTHLKSGEEEISDDEQQEFMASYKRLARSAESEFVREKTLRFLINEKKGRNDIIKEIQKSHVNVLILNENIRASQKAIERAQPKEIPINGRAIQEVESERLKKASQE